MNWLSANYKWLFDGVGGAVLIAVLAFVVRRLFLSEPPQTKDGGATLSEPSYIEQNVYLATPSPTPVAPAPPVVGPSREPPKPNIEFVETKSIQAHSGIKDGKIYASPQGLGDFQVCVVCFRNDPVIGRKIQESTLKAHIIYRDKNGDEISEVARGVWLGELGESTVFESGKKKCVVVFLLTAQNTLKKLWNERWHSDTSWMADGPVFQVMDEAIGGEVASVEVRLLGHDTCVFYAEFEVGERIGDGLPALKNTTIKF